MQDGRTTSKDRATQLLICEPLSFAIWWWGQASSSFDEIILQQPALQCKSCTALHLGGGSNAQHLSPSCFSPASAHLATTSHLDICLIAQPFSLSPELKAGCFLQRVILNSMEMSRVRCWEEPFHIFWHPFLQGSTWWQWWFCGEAQQFNVPSSCVANED